MKINEEFKDKDINGETIVMSMGDNAIAFGGRFEETLRVNLHGLTRAIRAERIRQCFDWFRNYATLFTKEDFARTWRTYQRACTQQNDSVRNAFWRFSDGFRQQQCGKQCFKYTKNSAEKV